MKAIRELLPMSHLSDSSPTKSDSSLFSDPGAKAASDDSLYYFKVPDLKFEGECFYILDKAGSITAYRRQLIALFTW